MSPTGYWTFFCTPERWNIDGFLGSGKTKARYQIQINQQEHIAPGQFGIISVLDDNRKNIHPWYYTKPNLNRGIYAVLEITSYYSIDPDLNKPDEFNYPYYSGGKKIDPTKPTVEVLFRKDLMQHPLYTDDLRSDILINNHPLLLTGRRGISCSVLEKATFDRILEIAKV